MRVLIQEMGGNPQDLSTPPPTPRQSEGEGITIRVGTAELWLEAYRVTRRWPSHQEGKKGRKELLQRSLVQVLW